MCMCASMWLYLDLWQPRRRRPASSFFGPVPAAFYACARARAHKVLRYRARASAVCTCLTQRTISIGTGGRAWFVQPLPIPWPFARRSPLSRRWPLITCGGGGYGIGMAELGHASTPRGPPALIPCHGPRLTLTAFPVTVRLTHTRSGYRHKDCETERWGRRSPRFMLG
jgi:hypothetical protein